MIQDLLYQAVLEKNTTVIKWLCHHVVAIEEQAEQDPELFDYAVKYTYPFTGIVTCLLKRGAFENTEEVTRRSKWDLTTPAHYFVQIGDKEQIQLFLDKGWDVNLATLRQKNTLLHSAINSAFRSKNLEIVKLLVARGANLYARNVDHETPQELVLIKEGLYRLEKLCRFGRGLMLDPSMENFLSELRSVCQISESDTLVSQTVAFTR